MPYLWIKALHVACVLLFIAGLFLQAVGIGAGHRGEGGTVRFARAWDRGATLPAMLLVWFTGVVMAMEGGWFQSPWLWVKLGLVLLLTGLHGVQSGKLRRVSEGRSAGPEPQTGRVLILVAISAACIALLVVTKPF